MSDDLGAMRACFQKALKLTDEEAAAIDAETSVWNFPKWNSLGHVALVLEVEKAFSVKFSEDQTIELISVEEISQAIESHSS